MYATHCLMVIEPCAKYGMPMSKQKVVIGRIRICKQTERQTKLFLYTPPPLNFVKGSTCIKTVFSRTARQFSTKCDTKLSWGKWLTTTEDVRPTVLILLLLLVCLLEEICERCGPWASYLWWLKYKYLFNIKFIWLSWQGPNFMVCTVMYIFCYQILPN